MIIFKIILCAIVLCCVEIVYGNDEETTTTTDAIETHPNLHLLPESCGDISGRRVLGGDVARPYEFPWMTLIAYKSRSGIDFDCSGTIINSKYILTAGHCATSFKTMLGVRVGEYDIRYKTDCQGEEPQLVCQSHLQDIQVEDIILHPNFTRYPDTQNDVALLRLKKPIDFNYKNALPICLPVTQELQNVRLGGMLGTVTGWGLTEYDIYSQVLLKVQILIHTDEDCASLISDNSPSSSTERVLREICAGENQKDSCKGDSGGPLLVQGIYDGVERYIQYGIVSRGPKKCGTQPGVYTDVTKYIEWILDNIKE